ncbi:MAG: hypothetical protein HYW65_02820 [Candidatus Liptonbacteria bacterium]|nr:hypothetical protein [Candidatus Liptonbacteria bacterium]
MGTRVLIRVSGIIFGLFALAHAVRAIFRWEITFAGRAMPIWASVLVAVIAAYLAYESFRTREVRYICTGECGGMSPKPGMCQAEKCAKKGMPLEEVSA